jgi:hypothetical protein
VHIFQHEAAMNDQTNPSDEVPAADYGKRKTPRAALLGAMRGKIVVAPDFDRTPDDIIDAMEDGDPRGR